MRTKEEEKMVADGWVKISDGKWRKSHGRLGEKASPSSDGANIIVRREKDFQTPFMNDKVTLSSNQDMKKDFIKRHMEENYPEWCNDGYTID